MKKYNIEYVESVKNFGDNIDLSEFKKWSISKCSVGNPNNKLSLVVMPIIASIGGKIAKISDRDNEYHQSIIEKLETIPGFCSGLPLNNFLSQLRDVGISIVGSSYNAPKYIPSLNNDIVLLAYSLIGRELAKGVYHIVFDIQLGPNEPIKTKEEAQLFYDTVKLIAESYNRKVTVFISHSNYPLGKSIGNTFEMQEAIKILRGIIKEGDFYNACLFYSSIIAAELYNIPEEIGLKLVSSTLNNGIAYNTFKKWIQTQGGDLKKFDNVSLYKYQVNLSSNRNGIIHIDSDTLIKIKKMVSNNAGIVFNKCNGDHINVGDTICTIYADNNETITKIKQILNRAISFGLKNNFKNNCYFETLY